MNPHKPLQKQDTRRKFLKTTGLAVGTVGLAGCSSLDQDLDSDNPTVDGDTIGVQQTTEPRTDSEVSERIATPTPTGTITPKTITKTTVTDTEIDTSPPTDTPTPGDTPTETEPNTLTETATDTSMGTPTNTSTDPSQTTATASSTESNTNRTNAANRIFQELGWLYNGYPKVQEQYNNQKENVETAISDLDSKVESDFGSVKKADVERLVSAQQELEKTVLDTILPHFKSTDEENKEGEDILNESVALDKMFRYLELGDKSRFNETYSPYKDIIDEFLFVDLQADRMVIYSAERYALLRELALPQQGLPEKGAIHTNLAGAIYFPPSQNSNNNLEITFGTAPHEQYDQGERSGTYKYNTGKYNERTGIPLRDKEPGVAILEYWRWDEDGCQAGRCNFDVEGVNVQYLYSYEDETTAKQALEKLITDIADVNDGKTSIENVGEVHKISYKYDDGEKPKKYEKEIDDLENAGEIRSGPQYAFAKQFNDYVIEFGFGRTLWEEKGTFESWFI